MPVLAPSESASFAFLLLQFAFSGALVLFLATRLTRYADALERTTDVGALWIGGIFLAIVTSLPEAVATIGSAVMKEALDLGVANLFGSNAFNLLIVVMLDLFQGKSPLLLSVRSSLLVAGSGGIVMLGLAGMAISSHQHDGAAAWSPWWGGFFSVALLLVYLVLSRVTTLKLPIHDMPDGDQTPLRDVAYPYSRRRIIASLGLYAMLLVLSASWLLHICNAMAITPFSFLGREIVLGRTVTGTFLLSAATSCPEVFVCLAALRLGQTNMAVANLLGSNMINMCFLPLMHAASRDPGFYARIDGLSISILMSMAMLMTGLFMLGLLVRSKRGILLLSWETISMLAVYVVGALLVLRLGLNL